VLIDRLEQAGDQPVVRHEGVDTSGRELLDEIHRSALALEALGIGRGDLVALYAPNRPDALAVRYATHLLGAASVFLSVPSEPDKRARMLVDFDPQLVVVWPATAHVLPPTTARVAAMGPVDGVDLRLDELTAAQPATDVPSRARPDDLAVIVSSGGTTGVPKGSIRDFATWSSVVGRPSPPQRRQLANGPLAYLTQILVDCTLLGGGTVVLQERFEAGATLAAIQAEQITDLFLVEPQLFELMDRPDLGEHDLSSLRRLTHIGASAAPVLRLRARERLGQVLVHTYGASEMGIVSMLSAAEHDLARPERFACAGRPLPGVEVRFRDEHGDLHPSAGAIEVRSPDMAAGYRHRPIEEATNFVDGWYRTGDLAHQDPDGYLHIEGRAGDCAEVEGRLATPTGLQEVLCRLPDVRYAVVVVDPDTRTRIAAIVTWPDRVVDAARCRSAVRTAYGDEIAASLLVLPMDRIPLTEQGKPHRTEIRRVAAAVLAS
jgi:fatty-acyl-CoA synthase